jgi:transcriptional regulator with XRE-family HTH domain
MLENERQYAVTRKKLAWLAECLAKMQASPNLDLPEIIRQADMNGIRFLMDDMEAEMAEYEKLRAGQISTLWLKYLLYDLPSVLSRARIARGWTHRDLANALGTSEQQVQKDERGGYRKASLARLERVATILGVRISGRARLPVGERGDLSHAEPGSRRRRVIPVKHPGTRSLARPSVQQQTARPIMSARGTVRQSNDPALLSDSQGGTASRAEF